MSMNRRRGGSIPKKDRINYEEAGQLYASGLSTPQVARILGSTSPTILRALKSVGVETRSIGDAQSLRARGNRRLDSGYITVCHEMGVRKKEHVLIAEAVLCRKLKKGEMVHHINGDKTDNRNCNLLICTISYHTWLHWRMRRNNQ